MWRKKLDMSKYELAIRETKTMEVIQEVSTMKSEIGVLYLSEFNRKSMEKLFKSAKSGVSSIDFLQSLCIFMERTSVGR